MSSPEIINFKTGYQYRSISYIEKLSKLSLMSDDFDYDYCLNLQTNDKLSNVINIYLNKNEIVNKIINPLKSLIDKKDSKLIQPIEINIKNTIPRGILTYYTLYLLLPDGYGRECLRANGCTESISLKYTLEDKRFIKIEGSAYYKYLFIKRKPKNIQPKNIILSLEEVDELILLLETSLV